MGNLKLAKLPDRSLIKCVIQITPDLERTLQDYAAAYEAAYGAAESPSELIPHMLAAFLESDREFARGRKS
jgi:hypothetical protein